MTGLPEPANALQLASAAYWTDLIAFDSLLKNGFVSPGDLELMRIAQNGVGDTVWSQIFYGPFQAAAGSTLTFRAIGTSDGLGGYVDNISLAVVPEPSAWALMILGFGMVGGALRRSAPRRASLKFA